MSDQPTPAAAEPITKEIKALEQAIMPLLTKQSAEIEKHGTTSTETRKALSKLEEQYAERMKDLDGVRSELVEIKKDLGKLDAPKRGRKTPGTVGGTFVGSDEYASGIKSTLDRVQPVQVKSFHQKTLLTGDTLGELDGFLYPNARVWDYVTEPQRDLHIRDLLPVIPTTDASLDYVVRTGDRWTAEIQESEGALKKEQALAFQLKQANAVTIAHHIPVTRQILRRAPQLRQYIDGELMYGIKLAEDNDLLYGDGSPGNIQGLMTNSDIQTYNRGVTGDTAIDTIRRAVTQLRVLHFRPSGVVLHPNDWERIEIEKDEESRYLWVTVPEGGVPRLWSVPVIDTVAIQEDEFLMGDFRIGAHLWDLERASIQVGTVNDQFIRNQLTILGEEDVIFTTELPRAFVKGDFGNVSS